MFTVFNRDVILRVTVILFLLAFVSPAAVLARGGKATYDKKTKLYSRNNTSHERHNKSLKVKKSQNRKEKSSSKNISANSRNHTSSIKKALPKKDNVIFYKVKKGDTLTLVSKKYNIPIDSILSINNLKNENKIKKGVIIKIPASRSGIASLEELTAQGIPTNVTLAYVISQFHAAAEAIVRGLQRARANGVDLTQWRSVITDMSGRWENAPEFLAEANKLGIDLTAEEIRWAGIAVFKTAYKHFREKAYPSKLLLCSMRVGPSVGGVPHIWHLEHTAGADAVFTFPPSFLNSVFTQYNSLEFQPRIWEDIPQEVYSRLSRVPYFCRAMDVYGYSIDEFDSLPPLISTRQEFSQAMEKMEDFVRNHMEVRISQEE